MRDARLLYTEVFHGRAEAFLVLVSVGLEIIDELEVHPAVYPVPVEVVYDDVLFHYALVVIAPGQEGHPVAAPLTEARERLREGHAVAEPLLVKARELFDLVVHTLEVDRLDVYLELLAGGHVIIEPDGAYLYDLAAQVYGKPVEHGGLGAHRLIPL